MDVNGWCASYYCTHYPRNLRSRRVWPGDMTHIQSTWLNNQPYVQTDHWLTCLLPYMAPLQIVKDPKIVMRFYSEGRVDVFVCCNFMSNSYHELGWARRAPPIRSISWDHQIILVYQCWGSMIFCCGAFQSRKSEMNRRKSFPIVEPHGFPAEHHFPSQRQFPAIINET